MHLSGTTLATRVLIVVGCLLLIPVTAVLTAAAKQRLLDGSDFVFSGGPLVSGELHTGPEPDWSFTNDIVTIELQLEDPPRSRTIWVGEHDGKLYVFSAYMRSAVGPLWKNWPRQAERDGRAVLRIGGKRYERQLRRIERTPHSTKERTMRCTARVAVVRSPHESAMRRTICALAADPCRRGGGGGRRHVAEEGIGRQTHAPVERQPVAPAAAAQQGEPVVAERRDRVGHCRPDVQQHCHRLPARAVGTFPGDLSGEQSFELPPDCGCGESLCGPLGGRVQPAQADLPIESDDVARPGRHHFRPIPTVRSTASSGPADAATVVDPDRSLTTKGTTTSSSVTPPWATGRSDSRTNDRRAGASRAR